MLGTSYILIRVNLPVLTQNFMDNNKRPNLSQGVCAKQNTNYLGGPSFFLPVKLGKTGLVTRLWRALGK